MHWSWLLLWSLFLFACGGESSGARDGGTNIDDGSPDSGSTDASGSTPLASCEPNLYVSADATGGGNGTSMSPWTLAEALATAMPGDTVEVGPGLYIAPTTGERHVAAFNPANSGEPEAPIVFCARHAAVHTTSMAELSELRNDAAVANAGSPTFGTYGRSYIVWDGFYVDEAASPSRSDTGPVTVWSSDHVTISRSVIAGATLSRQDNHNGIRLEAVEHVQLLDNRIHGVHSADGPDQNHASIMTYDASFVTIEHNEISDGSLGIYLKGDHAGDGRPNGAFTVRYNHVHDMEVQGIKILGVTMAGNAPSEVSHNLLVNNADGGIAFAAVDVDHPAAVLVHHNTIVGNTTFGAFMAFANTMFDVVITENLVSGIPVLYTSWDAGAVAQVMGNGFNLDDNFGDPGLDWTVSEAGYSHQLSAWRTFSSLDAASSVGNPSFVGAGDYHLAPGSSARTASSSSQPVGCYVTGDEVIGVRP